MQWSRARDALEVLRRIYSAPRIAIEVWGDEFARRFFRDCTARHPRLPMFRRKTLGAALFDLADEKKIAMAGGKFTYIMDQFGGWNPQSPEAAAAHGAKCIRVLSHPAHWRTNTGWALRFDAVRLWQGTMIRLAAP